MKVLLETSPLRNAHSIRGVGVYTRFLSKALEALETKEQTFVTSEDPGYEHVATLTAKQGVDIVHYPYFNLFQQTLPLPFMTQVFGKSRQKVVVTIHDVIPLLYPKHYPVGIKGSVGLWLQKYALQGVSAIITDSQTSKKDIIQYLGVPAQKVFAIPLAGNPELSKPASNSIEQTKKKFNLPDRYLLYVGDINYNKNIPSLIQALSSIDQNIHLVCVGANFKPHDIPEWSSIETPLSPVKNRVHFVTTIPKEDTLALSAVYAGAEVYVQPSLYEGFGLPLLEAMQCETLVVSSNTPALKEIGGNAVMYCEPTAEGISQTTQKALNLSASQKAEKKMEGLTQTKKYSWQKTAKETIDVYRQVL